MKTIRQFAGVSLGVLLVALGLNIFLIPNKIAAGGVSGIATILHYLIGVPVGLAILALDLPLFLMGIYRLGLPFALRSLFGTIALAFLVDILAPVLPVFTSDILLAALYGGLLTGLGLGLVFRAGGTTGGTDLAAAILRSYSGVNVGQLLFLVDGAVVIAAGLAFRSAELAMYALLTIAIASWLIDVVPEGISYARAFLIISDHAQEIAAKITRELQRGATLWQAQGVYTGNRQDVLLCIVNRAEVSQLKAIVYEVDPRAFVILSNVHEVFGEGFKRYE